MGEGVAALGKVKLGRGRRVGSGCSRWRQPCTQPGEDDEPDGGDCLRRARKEVCRPPATATGKRSRTPVDLSGERHCWAPEMGGLGLSSQLNGSDFRRHPKERLLAQFWPDEPRDEVGVPRGIGLPECRMPLRRSSAARTTAVAAAASSESQRSALAREQPHVPQCAGAERK